MDIEKLNEKIDIIRTTEKLKIYSFPIITLIVCIIISAILIFVKTPLIVMVIVLTFMFPLVLIATVFLIVKLIYDKNQISNFLIKAIRRNFLIANFYTSNKKILKKVVLLDNDGISFKIKEQTYIVDNEKIWFDEEKNPNSFYVWDLPNPIDFKFNLETKKFDINYSSINLTKFKKDKIFYEMHTPFTPEMMKILYIMGGVLALAFIVILVMVIILKRPIVIQETINPI